MSRLSWNEYLTGAILLSVLAQAGTISADASARVTAVILCLAACVCGATIGFSIARDRTKET